MEHQNQIGFAGSIARAKCDCHAGQFVVIVHAILRTEEIEVGQKVFPTEAEAVAGGPDFVKEIAHAVFRDANISDFKVNTEVVTPEEADTEIKKYRERLKESDRGLH